MAHGISQYVHQRILGACKMARSASVSISTHANSRSLPSSAPNAHHLAKILEIRFRRDHSCPANVLGNRSANSRCDHEFAVGARAMFRRAARERMKLMIEKLAALIEPLQLRRLRRRFSVAKRFADIRCWLSPAMSLANPCSSRTTTSCSAGSPSKARRWIQKRSRLSALSRTRRSASAPCGFDSSGSGCGLAGRAGIELPAAELAATLEQTVDSTTRHAGPMPRLARTRLPRLRSNQALDARRPGFPYPARRLSLG